MAENTPALVSAKPPQSLGAEQLYRHCDPDTLPFATTKELQPLSDALGQHRAVEALKVGLRIPHDGYNVFLLGDSGTGKHELLDRVLQTAAAEQRQLADWCYVNNFQSPDQPLALLLPPGKGVELRDDMAQAVEDLLISLPSTFQSDEYQSRVQELTEEYQSKEQEAFQSLAEKARAEKVAMLQTPGGYTLAPMKNDEVISPQDFEALPQAEQDRAMQVIEGLKEELKLIVRQLPGWKKESRERFRELNREFSRLAIDPVINELRQRYAPHRNVCDYLEAVHENLLENAEAFTQTRDDSAIGENIRERARAFPQYRVNVLVDNSGAAAPPIVKEDNPGFSNLIGRVENVAQMGTLVTDFTLIKPGALHRANGGYLIIEADKLLTSPYAWTTLKRALKAREIRIESLEQLFSFVSTVQLEPEPIPLNVKVVLTGERHIYYLLKQYDPEFSTLFRIAADMAEEVERSPDSTLQFARMIRGLQDELELLPLQRDAVAAVIEYAARHVQDSERLSLSQALVRDLLTQSDFVARDEKASLTTSSHVKQAVRSAIHRLDQFRERSHEGILRDIMLVDTCGSAIGQVNGLSVYQLGDYAFGKPTRITATARLGNGKVLDIEREVDLGGKIHSKAVMIISALLADRYARERPLPVAATLVFEQSYGGIEGDSASVAELLALISAIARVPMMQNLAVTGSLNQHGEVQAIGGVNEKIEGFFDICCARGLDGTHGVVIPAANTVHLMLRQDVLDAVNAGQFHVYAANTVDDALALLTGYTAESVDAAVISRVDELQAQLRRYAKQTAALENDADER